MSELMREIPYLLLVAGGSLIGLWWANYFFDHGISHWRSRKVAHAFGGGASLLAALLFESWVLPVALATMFALILGIANRLAPKTFRGTGGSGRNTRAMSEFWFGFSTALIWGIGWGVFNRPIESTACILMMSWGDAVGGWVRAFRYNTATKGWEGSMVNLCVCMVLAWAFLSPLWLGVLAAVGAAAAEYACGDVSKIRFLRWADDNLFIPVVAALIYFGGLYAIGAL